MDRAFRASVAGTLPGPAQLANMPCMAWGLGFFKSARPSRTKECRDGSEPSEWKPAGIPDICARV